MCKEPLLTIEDEIRADRGNDWKGIPFPTDASLQWGTYQQTVYQAGPSLWRRSCSNPFHARTWFPQGAHQRQSSSCGLILYLSHIINTHILDLFDTTRMKAAIELAMFGIRTGLSSLGQISPQPYTLVLAKASQDGPTSGPFSAIWGY